jgi:hypothetical protein
LLLWLVNTYLKLSTLLELLTQGRAPAYVKAAKATAMQLPQTSSSSLSPKAGPPVSPVRESLDPIIREVEQIVRRRSGSDLKKESDEDAATDIKREPSSDQPGGRRDSSEEDSHLVRTFQLRKSGEDPESGGHRNYDEERELERRQKAALQQRIAVKKEPKETVKEEEAAGDSDATEEAMPMLPPLKQEIKQEPPYSRARYDSDLEDESPSHLDQYSSMARPPAPPPRLKRERSAHETDEEGELAGLNDADRERRQFGVRADLASQTEERVRVLAIVVSALCRIGV